MPIEGKHAAKIKEPEGFVEIRTDTAPEGTPEGIEFLYGVLEDETTEVQSIHFDSTVFTVEDAMKWLEENGFEPIELEEATPVEENTDENNENQSEGNSSTQPIGMSVFKGTSLMVDSEGTVFWHLLMPEGKQVFTSEGQPVSASKTSLQQYEKSFGEYTRGGEYLPPALKNHDISGPRAGDILNCKYIKNGPEGSGLYFQIDWNSEFAQEIRENHWKYASVSIAPEITDWDGKQLFDVPLEVSATNLPQLTTLPSLGDGISELIRRTSLSRRKFGGVMPNKKSAPSSEAQKVDLNKIAEENAKLQREVLQLRRERSMGVVEQDMLNGYWDLRDDTDQSNFKKLVECHLEDPKTYGFYRSMSIRDSSRAVPARFGRRGETPDEDTNPTFTTRSEGLQFHKDKALELQKKEKIPYGEALSRVKDEYPII